MTPTLAPIATVVGTIGLVLTAALVAALAGLTRYLAGSALNAEWPLGTLAINSLGSFVAGAASGLTAGSQTIVVLAGLGALTSVSAVAGEVATMNRDARNRSAVMYVAITIITVVLCAWLGLQLAPAAS
ncbi:MAG: CrcB family protein [Actinobacteria bacterium]|nr:CrcB family protein [Actinomycetota bacterium]